MKKNLIFLVLAPLTLIAFEPELSELSEEDSLNETEAQSVKELKLETAPMTQNDAFSEKPEAGIEPVSASQEKPESITSQQEPESITTQEEPVSTTSQEESESINCEELPPLPYYMEPLKMEPKEPLIEGCEIIPECLPSEQSFCEDSFEPCYQTEFIPQENPPLKQLQTKRTGLPQPQARYKKVISPYRSPERIGGSLEWLYWKAQISNYSWAESFTPTTINFFDFGTKWDSGVRAGVHYDGPCCGGTDILYTHFYSVDQENEFNAATFAGSDTEGFEPVNLSPFLSVPGTFYSADATFKIQLDQVDWLLRQSFAINRKINLTPFAGARATVLRLTTNQFYQSNEDGTYGLDTINKWWAAGLVAGFNAEFQIVPSFSFFLGGDAGLGGGYSQSSGNGIITDGGVVTVLNLETMNQTKFHTMLDGVLGFMWQTSFSGYKTAIKLGYEGHFYSDSLPVVNFDTTVTNNNLTFQGLSLGGYFFF